MRRVRVRGQRFIGSCLRMKKDKNRQGILFEEVIKMRKRLKKISLGLVTVGACLVLLLGSAVPANAEAEEVAKIGFNGAWTGALATVAVPKQRGEIDYVRYVNDRGGIDGVKIQAVWEDFKGLSPRAITSHKRMVEAGILIETCPLDSAVMAMLPRLMRDEILCIYWGSTVPFLVTKPAWVVNAASEGENLFAAALEWMEENWTQERPLRVGFFHADQPLHNSVYENLRLWMEERGMEFPDERIPLLGVIDSSVEWLRLADKKPDWVIVSHYGATLVTVVKDAARLGIQERGIRIIADPRSLDEPTAKVTGKAAEGWYRFTLEPCSADLGHPDHPMLKTIIDAAKRYRGFDIADVTIPYISGWLTAMVTVEAIRLAVEKVGFEGLTGRAVRDAIFTIKDFDTGVIPPITITEDAPYYQEFCYFQCVERGEFVRLTEWRKMHRIFRFVMINGEARLERVK